MKKLVLVLVAVSFFASCKSPEQELKDKMVSSYNMAKDAGNHMDAASHAGYVAEYYLQKNNNKKYQEWHEIAEYELSLAMPK